MIGARLVISERCCPLFMASVSRFYTPASKKGARGSGKHQSFFLRVNNQEVVLGYPFFSHPVGQNVAT